MLTLAISALFGLSAGLSLVVLVQGVRLGFLCRHALRAQAGLTASCKVKVRIEDLRRNGAPCSPGAPMRRWRSASPMVTRPHPQSARLPAAA